MKKYFSPTPRKWRIVGDTLMICSVSFSGMVTGLPLSDNTKMWLVFIINAVGVLGKVITNFAGPQVSEFTQSTVNSEINSKG